MPLVYLFTHPSTFNNYAYHIFSFPHPSLYVLLRGANETMKVTFPVFSLSYPWIQRCSFHVILRASLILFKASSIPSSSL